MMPATTAGRTGPSRVARSAAHMADTARRAMTHAGECAVGAVSKAARMVARKNEADDVFLHELLQWMAMSASDDALPSGTYHVVPWCPDLGAMILMGVDNMTTAKSMLLNLVDLNERGYATRLQQRSETLDLPSATLKQLVCVSGRLLDETLPRGRWTLHGTILTGRVNERWLERLELHKSVHAVRAIREAATHTLLLDKSKRVCCCPEKDLCFTNGQYTASSDELVRSLNESIECTERAAARQYDLLWEQFGPEEDREEQANAKLAQVVAELEAEKARADEAEKRENKLAGKLKRADARLKEEQGRTEEAEQARTFSNEQLFAYFNNFNAAQARVAELERAAAMRAESAGEAVAAAMRTESAEEAVAAPEAEMSLAEAMAQLREQRRVTAHLKRELAETAARESATRAELEARAAGLAAERAARAKVEADLKAARAANAELEAGLEAQRDASAQQLGRAAAEACAKLARAKLAEANALRVRDEEALVIKTDAHVKKWCGRAQDAEARGHQARLALKALTQEAAALRARAQRDEEEVTALRRENKALIVNVAGLRDEVAKLRAGEAKGRDAMREAKDRDALAKVLSQMAKATAACAIAVQAANACVASMAESELEAGLRAGRGERRAGGVLGPLAGAARAVGVAWPRS